VKTGGRGLKAGQLGMVSPIYVKVYDLDDRPVDLPLDQINVFVRGPEGKEVPVTVLKSPSVGVAVIRYAPTKPGKSN
jgi:hypothetical protein